LPTGISSNRFRGAAQLGSQRRNDERLVHKEGMLDDEVQQLVVGPLRVAQTQLRVWRPFLAKQSPNRPPRRGHQLAQLVLGVNLPP
jgi:hypothetical protein